MGTDEVLTEDELVAALRTRPEWEGNRDAIRRTVRLPSFPAAIALVDAIAVVAEARDHHPDIDIRWRTVTFTLSTHSAGGVTGRDLELASQIDTLAAEHVAQPTPDASV